MSLKTGTPKPPMPTGTPTKNMDVETPYVPAVIPTPQCDTMWCKHKVPIIVGGVCGIVLLILVIALAIWFFKFRKPKEVVASEKTFSPEKKSALEKKKTEEPKKEEKLIITSNSDSDSDEKGVVKAETKEAKVEVIDKTLPNLQRRQSLIKQYGE